MRADDLGVFVMRRGRAHNEINVACYIRRVMADGYDYSLFAQMRGPLALRDIGAAYYKSCIGKHLARGDMETPPMPMRWPLFPRTKYSLKSGIISPITLYINNLMLMLHLANDIIIL